MEGNILNRILPHGNMAKTEVFESADLELWKHRTSQKLNEVKAKLMSREITEQMEAVTLLIDELKCNTGVNRDLVITALLKSEIVALLCERTMTMLGPLLRATLKCFSILTTSDQFHNQNHASYVVASILRTGHFLTMQDSEFSTEYSIMLESIVRTLDKILVSAFTFNVSARTICESKQVFEFLKKLLSNSSPAYRIVFSTATILNVVLSRTGSDDTTTGPEDEALVLEVVGRTLNLMHRIIEAENSSDGKYSFRALVMACGVCASGIRSCIPTDHDCTDEGALQSTHKAELANCIYSTMMKSVIPNFNKIELDGRNGRLYEWFVNCLNGIYDVRHCNTRNLSNYLAEQGYLLTVPRLTTFATQDLRNDVLLLLSRILTTLASVSLSADTWLGGTRQFKKFLVNAFRSLPPDPSDWPPFMSEGDDKADALLVFFYYYFLVQSTDAAPYLPLIVAYVISSSSSKTKRKSATIQKALWFTFCVTAVSHENPTIVKDYDTAVTRLFATFETLDLEQYYTHHPAVVVHCLQSRTVSEKLRANVVCLWLENDGDVGCLVDGTVDLDVTNHCLMEMVKNGSPRTVDTAMKAILEVLNSTENPDKLGNIVWEILPEVLAAGHEMNNHNTTSVLKLAVILEPSEMSGIALVRFLYQLIMFILKNESDSNLISLGIRNAYCLLQLCIHRNVVQGITMFTKEPRLIKVLKNTAFSKKDPGLSYICFRCLSFLVSCQAKYSIQSPDCSLEIELEDFLKEITAIECSGALELATVLLVGKVENPVIKLKKMSPGSSSDKVIMAFYLQLHGNHAKSGPADRELLYILLGNLLDHCKAVGNLKILKNLCELPWTYILIKMTIEANRSVMHSSFMTFISNWLFHRYCISGSYSALRNDRPLCRDQFDTTLDLIGKASIVTYRKYPKRSSLRELVDILMLFQDQFTEDVAVELMDLETRLGKN